MKILETLSTEPLSPFDYPPESLAVEAAREPPPAQPLFEAATGVEIVEQGDSDTPQHSAFARLVPTNDAAKTAFHELALAHRSGKIPSHHQNFITINPTITNLTLDNDGDKHENLTTDSEDDTTGQFEGGRDTSLLQGYFAFSFHIATGYISHSGYRIGKGSSQVSEDRNVDILLIPPPEGRTSSCTQRAARSISNNHSLIQVHPDSGVLMLVALSRSKPVKYQDADEEDLLNPQKHVLYRKKNNFWIGSLQYCFEYLVEPEGYDDYIQLRNAYLQLYRPQHALPHPAISAVPRDGDNRVEIAFVHKTINSGAFGVVWAGVHKLTGEPLAIKELCVTKSSHVQAVTDEVDIARRYSDRCNGLLQTVHIRCEHGGQRPSGSTPEKVYIFLPLARGNFTQLNWSDLHISPRLKLYRDTLEGVQALHRAGYIHRDVSSRNLLIVSLSPPSAALCDYGKATSEPYSSDPLIGPVYTLAPEVGEGCRYDKRIDVWSLAYAWYRTIDPKFPVKRVDRALHQEIMRNLDHFKKQGELHNDLAGLIKRMLAWHPADRISVDKALEAICMRRAAREFKSQETEAEESIRPRKRPHTSGV